MSKVDREKIEGPTEFFDVIRSDGPEGSTAGKNMCDLQGVGQRMCYMAYSIGVQGCTILDNILRQGCTL